jgi:hypothetical protein
MGQSYQDDRTRNQVPVHDGLAAIPGGRVVLHRWRRGEAVGPFCSDARLGEIAGVGVGEHIAVAADFVGRESNVGGVSRGYGLDVNPPVICGGRWWIVLKANGRDLVLGEDVDGGESFAGDLAQDVRPLFGLRLQNLGADDPRSQCDAFAALRERDVESDGHGRNPMLSRHRDEASAAACVQICRINNRGYSVSHSVM